MTRLYTNNYSTSLNGVITAIATTITVNSVASLPAIGGGATCQLTMDDGTNIEVVTATSVAGSVITVTRAQEGTSGFAFADASTVELRATALSYIDPDGTINFGGAVSLEIPNSATPTVNADGEVAIDTTVTDFSHGVYKYYGGEEMGIVAMPIAEFTTPLDGIVPTYNATNDEFEMRADSARIDAKVDSYTVLVADAGKIITIDKATATTLTLPDPTSLDAGFQVGVIQRGAGAVTVATAAGTIESKGSNVIINGENVMVVAIRLTSAIWGLYGDLV